MTGFSLAVDIGGTFTDVVLRHRDGRCYVDKTLTTHGDLLEGFFRAVDLGLRRASIGPADVDDVIVHATTLVTNAVIERKGPPIGLVVTEGFRDVLAIRDEHRYDMFDPQIEFPAPLVARERIFPLAERTLADASVAKSPDDGALAALAEAVQRQGIRALAVSLLNSYRNPANERAVKRRLAELAPGLYVSLSSEVAPQIREYPRTSTTVLNAYTQPITAPYLKALAEQLVRRGFRNQPLIMLSNGGVIGVDVASRFPVRMIESGPAAGALAASYFAELMGLDRLLSFDMGGTTAKACMIQERRPLVTGLLEVDRKYRFKPGSGFPVIIPSIDMIEIGAGGGSIAGVDSLGLLKVGPRSAGSEPGPVCYGRGGTEPTVTDADVALGLIDPDRFLGGDMKLDRAAAMRALAGLAAKLGIGTEQTALGIFKIVGESMASAARAHATDRGIDYRGLPLLAFGGAGPVHAGYVAELLDSSAVIYPPLASVLSAFGTLVTPARLDLVRGALARLGGMDWADIGRLYDEMEAEGTAALVGAGTPADRVAFEFGADMRYFGQQNEVSVGLPGDPRLARDATALRETFERAYEAQYGLRLPDVDVEVVTWRLVARGPAIPARPSSLATAAPAKPKGRRRVLFSDRPSEVPVYDRPAIAPAQIIDGPAIIEERETTIVIPDGWRATVEANGTIVSRRRG
ncbi:MAG: hydantoinase/oxoprolinase family protein [Proteobacteria bacterium]|nr:hydantoinase/oxoprolinase family protein [Pseudomonadota bacterium]